MPSKMHPQIEHAINTERRDLRTAGLGTRASSTTRSRCPTGKIVKLTKIILNLDGSNGASVEWEIKNYKMLNVQRGG